MRPEDVEFAPGMPTVELPDEPRRWWVDAAELLAEPDPGPTRWLVEDLIIEEALVALVGRWKVTKSYGVLDMCISLATGRPAFGAHAIPEPGLVVFANEESGRAALWRRLDALCRGRAIDPEELRGRLFVSANAGIKLDDPRWQNELLDLGVKLRARDEGPRLFVFDPLARMKAPKRKEGVQDEMSEVIEFWRLLRNETGAAAGLVAHTGHEGSHIRGTSDLETAWETKLLWERDGQSPVVTIKSEHREAEAAPPIAYRIKWDGQTRSMRFDLELGELAAKVAAVLRDDPDASANAVFEALGGNRGEVLAEVRRQREAETIAAIEALT